MRTRTVAKAAGMADAMPPPTAAPQADCPTRNKFLPTRHSLLQRLKDWNDGSSWDEFFKLYGKLIYRTALKAGLSDAEAQDVVQETILSVAKNIDGFVVGSDHGSFKAWLLRLTRWRIADQLRRRPMLAHVSGNPHGSDPRTSTTDQLADPASLTLDDAWDRDWEENVLAAALAKVKSQADPTHYQLFQLHVIEQWPAQKVAERLGVRLSQVYFAKYRVLQRIRAEVKQLKAEMF